MDWVSLLIALCSGTALGFVLGLVPGLGGKTSIILATPLALLWDGPEAGVFLIALHSVIHTSSSIPAIAFGVPVTSADLATVQDGFPLARAGRASEALGASLSASALGGVIGALAFLALIPFSRLLVTQFGPPEFLAFACIGVSLVATISESGLRRGLILCALGILISMIGIHPTTSEPRFTFGLYDLWQGVPVQVIVAGMFVVPEMLTIMNRPARLVELTSASYKLSGVVQGMLAALRFKLLILRSSLYGILIGILPGVGSSVACWWSYAYAARNVKSDVPYGEGALPGVIAPEAANNSKEGGALLPTLLLGIPGSSVMAIIMVALITVGVPIGPQMASSPELAYVLGATIIAANFLAVPLFFGVIPFITRISLAQAQYVAIIAIAVALGTAISKTPVLTIYFLLAVASLAGIALEQARWSRAPLLLGFVLGSLVERSYYQTEQIWGWSAFERPLFLLIVVAGVFGLLKTRKFQHPGREATLDPPWMLFGLFAVFMTVAIYAYLSHAGGLPFVLVISLGGAVLTGAIAFSRRAPAAVAWPRSMDGPIILLAGSLLLGLPAGIAAYFLRLLLARGITGTKSAMISGLAFVLVVMACVWLGSFPSREALGLIAWKLLDY